MRECFVWPLLAGLVGCRAEPASRPADEPGAAAVTMADTMVLRTDRGAEVWLAEGREARDSAGVVCYERSVEIRSDTVTRKVPLLFVTRAPVPLGPDAIRAELSLRCRTIAVYRVDLASARPTKLEDR